MNKKGQGLVIGGSIVFFIVLISLLIGFDQVPAGNVGVKDRFGVVENVELSPGLYWTGLFTHTIPMSTQIQKVEYNANAASKDLQIVTTQIAVNFRLEGNLASEMYSRVGEGYESVIIHPLI